MSRLILFHKPWGVLCRFRAPDGTPDLSGFGLPAGVYPAGRLDKDSEGLLLLTDNGALQHRITHPRWKMPKQYRVQVEGLLTDTALRNLRRGVTLKDGPTRPCRAEPWTKPDLPERVPPVRQRRRVPDSWLILELTEGRNRQVRRMTAAVGLPTLRLVRWAIGPWTLAGLAPGEWREETVHLPEPSARRQRR